MLRSGIILPSTVSFLQVMGYSVRVSAVEAMVRGRVTEILICDAILAGFIFTLWR